MIASEHALIGGHRSGDIEVCPPAWSDGLEEITIEPGAGIVPWTIEVHAVQAGLLGRAVAVATSRPGTPVVALDEDTALHVDGTGETEALGSGHLWWVKADDDGGARVMPRPAG